MFHFIHKYKILTATKIEVFEPRLVGGYIDGHLRLWTEIREVCQVCGKPRIRNIKGVWSKEDLTPLSK